MKPNKAIFVCGSGGSGKSTFIKKNIKNFNHIDVDIFYEQLLKKANLGLNIKNFSIEQIELANKLFEQASDSNHKFLLNSVTCRENIVMESIGRNVDIILQQRDFLEQNGYDTYMIMLYTELELCITRVENRERSYNKMVTISSWYDSYKNIPNYKMEFKEKFILVKETNTDISQFIESDLLNKSLL